MGLTPEAEEAQDQSYREEREERKRQAKQQENNEQLVEMLAKKIQTPPSLMYLSTQFFKFFESCF